MKKKNSLSLAAGAMFATTVLSPAAFAADNPFAMQKLSSGYQLAEADMTDKKMDGSCSADKKAMKMKDGKCGEGKCGASKKKVKEGSCSADKKKDGSCSAGMKMDAPKAEESK
ncbi:MAG: hypothetical protein WAX67_01300 [Rugosibacter sp.]